MFLNIFKIYSLKGVLLSGGLNIWLIKTFDWTLIKKSKVACKLLPFFIYTILDFSVAIIVIMTGHKVYAVSSPINASQRKFDRKIPTIIILVALVICFSINSHFLVSHSLLEFHELKLIDNVYYIHLIKVCTHKISKNQTRVITGPLTRPKEGPIIINWSMELFSKRRWATGSAQQSNNFGMYVLHNFFGFNINTTASCLGRSSCSSPNIKELHDWRF